MTQIDLEEYVKTGRNPLIKLLMANEVSLITNNCGFSGKQF